MDGTSIAERKWTEGQRKGLSTWSVWVFTGLLKVLSLMHWEIKKKKKNSGFGVLLHFCGNLSSQMMT